MIRVVLVLAMLTLGACGTVQNLVPGRLGETLRTESVAFEGIYFRARAQSTSEDRRDFTVSVARADQNIAAALEAGRFEAVKYCLGRFGGSDIAWTMSPDEDPDTILLSDDNSLLLTGRCTTR